MRTAVLGLLLVFCFSVSAVAAQQASAQMYQGRTVRVVIPSGAGGNPDILGRLIARKLSEDTGGTFVVINRPGASGAVGNEIVAKALPDGYTLLVTATNYVTSTPHTRLQMPYDSLNDLVPVVQIATSQYVLVSHPNVPAKTVRELIELAKTKSGFLAFSSSGIGSGYHLAGEMINQMAGVNMLHVPYNGAPAALSGLLTEEVDFTFSSFLMIKPFAEAGRLRIIATGGMTRDPALPHIPTLNESGLPGYKMTSGGQGMFVPKGTPQSIVEYLNRTVHTILATTEMKTSWKDQGMNFTPNTPAQFTAIIKEEYDDFGKRLRAVGIKPE